MLQACTSKLFDNDEYRYMDSIDFVERRLDLNIINLYYTLLNYEQIIVNDKWVYLYKNLI